MVKKKLSSEQITKNAIKAAVDQYNKWKFRQKSPIGNQRGLSKKENGK